MRENVLVGAAIAGLERALAAREADRLLGALGITQLGARRPSELSGGEEQRAAVARALVHRPAALFADEPTANLDGRSGRDVAQALAEVAREAGVAVVVVSHDHRLREFATRRMWMEDGCLRAG